MHDRGNTDWAYPFAMDRATRNVRFRNLYGSYFGLVWSVLGCYGFDGPGREDAAQEVWLAAFRRLDTLHDDASAKAWLGAIARNTALRLRRNAYRHCRRTWAAARRPAPEVADPESAYVAASVLTMGLDSLTAEQRQVLLLSRSHGMTAGEIGEALGISATTVYGRLRAATRRFEDSVEKEASTQDTAPEAIRRRVTALVFARLAPMRTVAAAGSATALGAVAATFTSLVAISLAWAVGAAVVTAYPDRGNASRFRHQRLPTAVARSRPMRLEPPPIAALSTTPTPATPTSPSPPKRRSRPGPRVMTRSQSPEPLGSELTLLRQAHAALRSGDGRRAMTLLKRHVRQFPDSRLEDVRNAAQIRALCSLGRPQQAHRFVESLRRRHPKSPLVVAVGDGCTKWKV